MVNCNDNSRKRWRQYPRITTCPFTGIRAVVKSEQEEIKFQRDGVVAFLASLGVCFAALVVGLFFI